MLENCWTVRRLKSDFGDSGDISRKWSLSVVKDGGHCVCMEDEGGLEMCILRIVYLIKL